MEIQVYDGGYLELILSANAIPPSPSEPLVRLDAAAVSTLIGALN